MKLINIFFLLFLSLNGFNQDTLMSTKISNEIKKLSLENNRLIIQQYLSEYSDSTHSISLFKIGKDLVTAFIKSHNSLAILDSQYQNMSAKVDSIRKSYPAYKKLLKNYASADTSEKRELTPEFQILSSKIGYENPEYSKLRKDQIKVRSELNRLTLITMLNEYQKDKKSIPLIFITQSDLIRYNQEATVRQNYLTLEILYKKFTEIKNKEIDQQYKLNN